MPIYQTATFSSADADELGAVAHRTAAAGYVYARLGNPTVDALARCRRGAARRRGGVRGRHRDGRDPRSRSAPLVCGRRPDRRDAGRLRHDAEPLHAASSAALGVRDRLRRRRPTSPPSRRALAAAPTRVLYLETISNPTIVVADLAALAELGHRHGAARRRRQHVRLAVPLPAAGARRGPRRRVGDEVPLRPLGRAGRRRSSGSRRADRGASARVHVDTGGDPRAVRRVPRPARHPDARRADGAPRRDRRRARRARWRAAPGVARVLYPGLPSHPQHAVAARLLRSGGGMLAVELAGGRGGRRAPSSTRCGSRSGPRRSGSIHTIVVHPPSTTHRQLDAAAARRGGDRARACCASRWAWRTPTTCCADFAQALLRRRARRPPATRRSAAAALRPPTRGDLAACRPRRAPSWRTGRRPARRAGRGRLPAPDLRPLRRRPDRRRSPSSGVVGIVRAAAARRARSARRRTTPSRWRIAPGPLRAGRSGAGVVDAARAPPALPRLQRLVVHARSWSCWSSRSSSARSTGRPRLWRQSRRRPRRPAGRRSTTRRLPDRAVIAGGPRGDDVRGRPAPAPASGSARRSGADGDALPLRRPQPVREAGHAAHPRRADRLPGRGRGDRAAFGFETGLLAPGGPGRRPSSRIGTPDLLSVKNLGFEAPARRRRPLRRLHDRPRRLPGRAGDRAQDDPRQRPARASRGYTFHQNVFGPAVDLTIRERPGGLLWSGPVPLDDDRRRASRTGSWSSRARDAVIQLLLRDSRARPTPCWSWSRVQPGRTDAAGNPTAYQTLVPGLAGPGDSRPRPTSTSRSTVDAMLRLLGLIAKRDPGAALVWISFVLLIVGLAITFYLPRRRVWARLAPAGRAAPGRPRGPLRGRAARVRRAPRRTSSRGAGPPA